MNVLNSTVLSSGVDYVLSKLIETTSAVLSADWIQNKLRSGCVCVCVASVSIMWLEDI